MSYNNTNSNRKISLGLVRAHNVYLLDGKRKKKVVNPLIWFDIDRINNKDFLHLGINGEFIDEYLRKEMEPHFDIYIPKENITKIMELLEIALKPVTPKEEFNLADFMRRKDEEIDELSNKD